MRIFPLLILALLLTIQSAFGVALTFGTINGGQSSDPTSNNTILDTSPTVTGQVFNTLGVLWSNTRLTKDICWRCGDVVPRGNGQAGFANDDPYNYYMWVFNDFTGPYGTPAPTYARFVDPSNNASTWLASQVQFVVLGKPTMVANTWLAGVTIVARDANDNIVDSFYVPPVDVNGTRPDWNVTLGNGIAHNIAYIEFTQNWTLFPQYILDQDGNPVDVGFYAYTAFNGSSQVLTQVMVDNFKFDAVPEPSTFGLGALALIGLGVAKYRRRRVI